MGKVIFFHMNQLGDLLFSLPLLKAVRQANYDEIISYVNPQFAPLLEATGYIDGVISKKNNLFSSIKEIKRKNVETAIHFSESPKTALISYFSGIPKRYGFNSAQLGFLLTHKIPRKGVPSVNNNSMLSDLIGIRTPESDYTDSIKIPENILIKANQWLQGKNIEKSRMIVIGMGASKRRREKCWPENRWIRLLEHLHKASYFPVIIGAPNEKHQIMEFSKQLTFRPAVYCSEDGILLMAAIMSMAKMFIGIDSGAMHLAAAMKTQVIAIFGKTDPMQIGPQPISNHRLIKNEKISEITVDEVVRLIGI